MGPVLPAAANRHPHNAPALAVLEEMVSRKHRACISAHSLTEVYSVLTRTPFKPPLYSSEAWQIIEEMILPHISGNCYRCLYPRNRPVAYYGTLGSPSTLLNDQHTVTIRVEAIPLLDRVPVRRQHEILAAQRADQQQQARPRQVEIGQHGAGEAELEARINEQVRLAAGPPGFGRAPAGRAHRPAPCRGLNPGPGLPRGLL